MVVIRAAAKRATIKDVADACGVSAQTVSRVINQHPSVAPATRQRIEETIDKLRYTPSALARSLQSNRSNTIGVLLAGMNYTGPAETFVGIVAECAERHHTVLVADLPDIRGFDPAAAVGSLLEHRVDGIIMSVPQIGNVVDQISTVLDNAPVPIVFVRTDDALGHSGISVDNADAITQVVDHLVGLGRQRIAHISGPTGWREAQIRAAAWSDRLAHHHLEAPANRCEPGDWSADSGAVAMAALLERAPEIDAVVVSNDRMAMGALYALKQRGVRIPDDIAIVGFDDIPEAPWTTPSLSSVTQPLQEMGRAAVRILLDHSGGLETPSVLETLRCQLVVRESSAGASFATLPSATKPA